MSNTATADRIAISDDAGNTVYVRSRRMGWGTKNKVISAAMSLHAGSSDVDVDIGAWNTALLLHNIVAWDGPDLDGKAVTTEALDDLDPDLGDEVLAKINDLNPNKADDAKKA